MTEPGKNFKGVRVEVRWYTEDEQEARGTESRANCWAVAVETEAELLKRGPSGHQTLSTQTMVFLDTGASNQEVQLARNLTVLAGGDGANRPGHMQGGRSWFAHVTMC